MFFFSFLLIFFFFGEISVKTEFFFVKQMSQILNLSWKYWTFFMWTQKVFFFIFSCFRKLISRIFRENVTVWKSTIKRYHARKFSVNPHNKNILNLLLQIHDFLLFGDVFGSSGLNEFWRLVHMLEFIVKNIFSFNGHN